MKPTKTFDKEAVKISLARLKKAGESFEVVIDPDKIIEYKNNKDVSLSEILRYEKIFSDARKGYVASDTVLKSVFGTDNPHSIAKVILDEGEIQFTQEYREKLREEKKKRIVDIIVRNAVDPRTHIPHPRTRIEAAIDEARVRFDEIKDAKSQVKDVVDQLKPILPIKFETKVIQVKIGPAYAPKAYSIVQNFGTIKSDNWQTDGSWVCTIEIPAGIQNDLFDSLNKLTHGELESKIIEEK